MLGCSTSCGETGLSALTWIVVDYLRTGIFMETVFSFILMFTAITLITVLLIQARGTGSSLFGEATSTFRSRRGVEQLLFRATIVLSFVFVGVAIINVRVS
jgi:protein translocase SecG subunit